MNKLANIAPWLVMPITAFVGLVGMYLFLLLFQDIPAWGYPNSGFQLLLVFPIFIITGTFISVQRRLLTQKKGSNSIGIIWTLFSLSIVWFLLAIVVPHITNPTSSFSFFIIIIYLLCSVMLLTQVAAFLGYVVRVVRHMPART